MRLKHNRADEGEQCLAVRKSFGCRSCSPIRDNCISGPAPSGTNSPACGDSARGAARASIAEAASQTAADSTEAETAVVGRQRSEHGRAASGARCTRRGSSPAGCRGRTVPHHHQTGSYHRKPLQRAAAGASVVAGSATQGTLQLGRETAAARALAVAWAALATQVQMLLDWPLTRRVFTRPAPSLENPML